MKELFQVPAEIVKVETLNDRTIRLRVDTAQEIPSEQEAMVMQLRNKIGWFVFSESAVETEDIPDTKIQPKGEKSPSQRLREVLYRFWEHSGKLTDFDTFYKNIMNGLIETYKAKLN